MRQFLYGYQRTFFLTLQYPYTHTHTPPLLFFFTPLHPTHIRTHAHLFTQVALVLQWDHVVEWVLVVVFTSEGLMKNLAIGVVGYVLRLLIVAYYWYQSINCKYQSMIFIYKSTIQVSDTDLVF